MSTWWNVMMELADICWMSPICRICRLVTFNLENSEGPPVAVFVTQGYAKSGIRTQQMNSLKIREAYNKSKTTLYLQKALSEENPNLLCIFLCDSFLSLFQNNFPNNVWTKICTAELDSPCQIFLCQNIRSFWGASVCARIFNYKGSQSGVRVLDNIVLARTSDS